MLTEPTANDYRMTELGPLPPEWRVVRLGEVVTETQQVNPRQQQDQTFKYIDVSCVDNTSLMITNYQVLSTREAPSRARKLVKTDDVIFATIRPYLKRIAQIPLELNNQICSTAFCVLRPNKNLIDKDFLFFAVTREPFIAAVTEHQRGSSYPAVTDSDVLRESITLPPLAEQRAIAHTLRAAQQAKLSNERMVAALRTVKQSLMHHLFRYGPVPLAECDRVPLRETPLGPLPAHWQVVRLGEVVEETQQVNPRQQQNQTFKYIDVSCVDNISLTITNYQIISTKEAPSRARKRIKTGDVIFATIRPYLKRIAQIPLELNDQICSTAFCVLRPNKNLIDKDFLFFAVAREPFIAAVTEHQRGSSYPAVTDSDVLRESLPLPPLAEQQHIATILQAVDRRIAAAESRVRALADLFAALLRDLMTARRRIPPEVVAQFAG